MGTLDAALGRIRFYIDSAVERGADVIMPNGEVINKANREARERVAAEIPGAADEPGATYNSRCLRGRM